MNSAERLKVVQYIVEVYEYIEKINLEIETLIPEISDNVKAYRKYKRLLGEAESMRQQIRDCADVLRRTGG